MQKLRKWRTTVGAVELPVMRTVSKRATVVSAFVSESSLFGCTIKNQTVHLQLLTFSQLDERKGHYYTEANMVERIRRGVQ